MSICYDIVIESPIGWFVLRLRDAAVSELDPLAHRVLAEIGHSLDAGDWLQQLPIDPPGI